ncbi:MAG TPA: trypsin-like peptidase domain-containing protein [Thermoanaerobaculia bacterium]|nr:trypsin-like peptidase domain-containing protein [Thermoanaerobaculia bacterium]
MRDASGKNAQVAVVVVAAVAFGMVLAGGLGWTGVGFAAEDAQGPQTVAGGAAAAGLPGFAQLAGAVGPAVVSIRADTFQEDRREIDPFEFFFGPRRRPDPQAPPQPEEEPERFRAQSGGSGFVVSADGLIVTNNHVVEGADRLTVTLEGRQYPAEVRGTDPETDLALIQIEAGRQLPYLKLGSSEDLEVGDWIMVIGSPLGLDHTVTVGVVSAKGRSLQVLDPSFENFIQTDAAINFGNSGGPLVNLAGEVVGIATLINFGAENIGFAVPVSTLHAVLPQLRESGRVVRGYLGIEIENLSWPDAQSFGRETTDGALVNRVVEGQPAAVAGLQHGDIVVRVDEVPVVDTRDLIDYVSAQPPGTTVEIQAWRNGEMVTFPVELGERPGAGDAAEEPEGDDAGGGIEWMGIRFQELTPPLRESHGLPESAQGLWVTDVDVASPLADEGVQEGDLIVEVGGRPVNTVEELERRVEEAPSGSFLRLYVQRFDPASGQSISFFAPVQKP